MTTAWDGLPVPRFPPLSQELTPDVCVVGAGIAGLSIAYSLLREGLTVVVLDAKDIGQGETGATSAHPLRMGTVKRLPFCAQSGSHGRSGTRI